MASNDATAATSSTGPQSPVTTKIQVLPKEVVDRIAAGEVVQRPANALKELLENSLDAGATKIVVHVDKQQANGKQKNSKGSLNFSISDNGHGIAKNDLLLAATRFATSKLTTVDDFSHLSSFGFRGEALASISMVSHLTITSRTSQSPVAFECTYLDGQPEEHTTKSNPRRCARTLGTTVKVDDLFYNVPHRKRALNPNEEYPRILATLQPYAVQVAKKGVGLIVQQQQARGKTTKTILDVNTTNLSHVQGLTRNTSSTENTPANTSCPLSSPQQQAATKQVIATIYGSHLEQHLLYFQSTADNDNANENDDMNTTSANAPKNKMSYACEGYLTAPSLAATDHSLSLKQATLLLFVNERHVECPPLKRRLEDIYASLTAWKKPPFVYLSLHVPASEVDVNVHPTKTQVALLYLDDIVAHLATQIQVALAAQGKTFGQDGSDKTSRRITMTLPVNNPYKKKPSSSSTTIKTTTTTSLSSLANYRNEEKAASQSENSNNNNKRKSSSVYEDYEDVDYEEEEEDEDHDSNGINGSTQGGKGHSRPPKPPRSQTQGQRRSSSASAPSSKAPYPSQLIRTQNATPVGAIEPFLVKQPRLSLSQTSSRASTPTGSATLTQSPAASSTQSSSPGETAHQPPCPFATESPLTLADVDMTQPGAFAQLSQQCTCREAQMQEQLSQQQQESTVLLPSSQQRMMIRPKDVTPTECKLDSILALRRRVKKRADLDLQQKLRQAYFVGVVSEHRTLVQCQDELCLLQHTRLAQALFYQLALARFGDNQIASFEEGTPIRVCTVIEQALQLEEDLQEGKQQAKENGTQNCSHHEQNLELLSEVDETNVLLASQATDCLWDNSAMLEEYFGIRLEQIEDDSQEQQEGLSQQPTKPVVVLTGLPILLEGHAPPPHGLPLFLLRLATEVTYEEERPCFDGICRELGNYYAKMPPSPGDDDSWAYNAYIQHSLFPALACLLVPSQKLKEDCRTLTRLTNLYKVFERC